MRSLWIAIAALPAVALPAVAADPPDHRRDGDAAITARGVLQKHCNDCHGDSDAKRRKGRLWVNNWASLKSAEPPVSFVSLDETDRRSQVVEFLKDGSMPPGGRPRPTPTEIAAVARWVESANLPREYPERFDTDAVLQLIVDDQGRTEKTAKNVRYVSLAHLVEKAGADTAKATGDLATAEADLTRVLGELLKAVGRPTKDVFGSVLKPVLGSAGTVFRLNLELLGWHDDKILFDVAQNGKPKLVDFRMIAFDLIQLEYPYTHPPKRDELKKPVADLVGHLNAHRKNPPEPLAQLRAVPFVRGDWLAAALMRDGKWTPLARDLEALAKLNDALKAEDDKTTPMRRVGVGPEFVPFVGGLMPADATAPSPWAWYQGDVVPPDQPTALGVTKSPKEPLKQNGQLTLNVNSDRAAAVTLIEVQHDYVDVRPRGMGAELKAGESSNVSFYKENGTITVYKDKAVGALQYVVLTSPKPAPPKQAREPVVVRSKHEQSAVWRVLPNAADVTDPDAAPQVFRRVVTIDVKTAD